VRAKRDMPRQQRHRGVTSKRSRKNSQRFALFQDRKTPLNVNARAFQRPTVFAHAYHEAVLNARIERKRELCGVNSFLPFLARLRFSHNQLRPKSTRTPRSNIAKLMPLIPSSRDIHTTHQVTRR
jgi:hypothetical protein